MRPTTSNTPSLTPGQAHYVITRLLNERRLTTNDINQYLNDLQHEITTITERLAILRATAQPPATHSTPRTTTHRTTSHSIPSNTKRRTASGTLTRRTPSNTTPSNTPIPSNTTTKVRRHYSPAARAQQQLQGRYLGYMRQLPAYARPRFQAIKARDGYDAAITALKQHLGK